MAEYNVNEMEVSMFGESPFYGIKEMSYDMEQEKTHIHVVGQASPYSTNYSHKKFTGKITVLHSAYMSKIQTKIPASLSVLDLSPFTISIVYKGGGNLVVTDKWVGVEVTKTNRKFATGDGIEAIELEVMMLDVIEGVPG